ncbi:MAG TPA: KEOPS complex subunit Pcc1 [Methanocorpusculum sp.]|nr:hypothetical protein [Candidatus Methanocorpusculum equi]MCQ2357700.1 hypothetical protein [Methanocorpusculum sp.]HJJ33065.1 KEOPS complex subunit Pcc1 [Methanocorpusculum sp.]HJJ44412.1 KEOPS complex subunit Pcc1 [Methanocorpusculum sp.]HJJ58012.1 KEOPS complex subunit Pcc1 [Methanocorpusculum sp.]
MKITGRIVSKTDCAEEIAEALSPDNAGFMKCSGASGVLTAEFSGESPRTVLATADDYLMNLSVAWQISESAKEHTKNSKVK